MRALPINELRSFVTVAELGSFTRAATLLNQSQPTISLQVQRLESQLCTTLLSRSGRTIGLTNTGDRLYNYAKKILALNDSAIAHIGESTISGRVRLGIPSEFAIVVLPKILRPFSLSYPDVSLEIVCELSKNLLSRPSKHYDLVLAIQKQSAQRSSSLVRSDELVWVRTSQYNVENRSPMPLVLAPDPCIYREAALNTLDKCGLDWRISYCCTDIAGIRLAIEEGMGVTVLARSTVPDTLTVQKTSERFPKLENIEIHLHYDLRSKDRALARLVDYVHASL